MFRSGLRIFMGTLVLISIIFYPLPLWAPAKSISADLWLRLRPAFVQQTIVNKAEPPQPASNLPPAPQPAEGDANTIPPQTAATEAAEPLTPEILPADISREENPQTAAEQQKKAFPVEIPPAFYRLDVPDKVAITFDDGPCPGMTEQYLEVLQAYDIQSTFFVIGRQVGLYPETAGKIIAQGSEIGSHSWLHAPLDQLKPEQIAADLEETAAQIYTLLGQETLFFRPPYGRGSADVLTATQKLDQKLVYWDVDPRDWKNPLPEEIVKRVMEQVKPGSIIILHEGRQNTLAALPGIIEGLQARGLQPVSVSALLSAAE